MKMRMRREQGSLMMMALVVLAVLGVVGVVVSKFFTSTGKIAADTVQGGDSFNVAESGAQVVVSELKAVNCLPNQLSGAVVQGNDVTVTRTIATGKSVTVKFTATGTPNSYTAQVTGNNRRTTSLSVTCTGGSVPLSNPVVGNAALEVGNGVKVNGHAVTSSGCSSASLLPGEARSTFWARLQEIPGLVVGNALAAGGGSGGKGGEDKDGGGKDSGDKDGGSGSKDGGGKDAGGGSADCNVLNSSGQLTSASVDIPSLGNFPGTGTTSVSIDNNKSQTVAPGSYSSLTVGNNGTVTLTPGTYYIDALTLSQNASLVINPSGSVTLHIRSGDIEQNANVNVGGSTKNLVVYLYGS
ncbi:MAG: hypothetical protein HQL56_06130 [Magnetococcales bacterium]|nr:hypothetical protein [Magnetococcales bacterium]